MMDFIWLASYRKRFGDGKARPFLTRLARTSVGFYSFTDGCARRVRSQAAHGLGSSGCGYRRTRRAGGIASTPHRVAAEGQFCSAFRLPSSGGVASVSSGGVDRTSRGGIASGSPSRHQRGSGSSAISRPCGQGGGHIMRFEADPRGSFDGAWFASASPRSGGCTVPAGGRFGVQNTAGWP